MLGIQQVEASDAAKHPTTYKTGTLLPPFTENKDLSPNSNSVEVEKPCSRYAYSQD